MDSRPANGLARAETGAHRLQRLAGAPDLRVTIHARLGGRDVREAGGLDRGVAVAAIEAESTDVVRMTERHRLFTSLRRARLIRRAVDLHRRPREEAHDEDAPEDRDS